MTLIRQVWLGVAILLSCGQQLWSQTKRFDTPIPTPGSPVFDELAGAARNQLDRAQALVHGEQITEAIEILRQIVDADGEKIVEGYRQPVVQLSGFSHYITAREIGLAQLARLQKSHPQEFAAYRRQLDAVADRWLKQGLANRDEAILRRLVQEMLLSSAGDNALLALGEIAFERGEYNAARKYWERIHSTLRFPTTENAQLKTVFDRPLWLSLRGVDLKIAWPTLETVLRNPRAASADGNRNDPQVEELPHLVYPDTDLNLADVRARLVLVSIFEGNLERAAIEIEILRQIAGGATGTIAGREGNLVELLEKYLAESRTWSDPPVTRDWTTFAGQPARRHVVDFVLPEAAKPLWTIALPRITYPQEPLTANRVRVGERSDGLLAYHPLVVGDRVVVQSGDQRNHVVVCDRKTGRLLFPSSKPEVDEESSDLGRGILGVPRFTSTAVEDSLFVRTGIPLSVAPSSRGRVSRPARIEALSLSADGKLLWDFAPRGPGWGDDWTVGGAPVSDGDQLFIALIRRGPLRIETHLAAIDLRDGRAGWRRFLCAAEPAFEDTISLRTQTLLTLDQGVIYCNTNQGVVAACDAKTGATHWLTAYPRTALSGTDPDRNDLHFYRDLNPCLVFQDLVIVAASDCNRLFALDANSGLPIWVTPAEFAGDVVHFLGVGGNNLLASGECLYWFDVYTGRLVGQYPAGFLPAPGFARPSPRSYGRGILVGSHVYWPTYESILVFEQRLVRGTHGWEPVAVREIPLASGVTGGNLVAGNDVLLIAGADQLAAFRTLATPSRAERQEHGIGR